MKNSKYINQQILMLIGMVAWLLGPINAAILSGMQPLKDACNILKAMVEAIQLKMVNYKKLIKSYSESKKQARLHLSEACFPVMSAARAYCLKTGNISMAEQLNVTLKELQTMPFKALLDKSALAIQEIDTIVAQLAPYNVTPELMLTWKSKQKALYDLLKSPSQAIKERNVLGEEIAVDVAKAMDFFHDQVTPLVGNFAFSQPKFYNTFQETKRVGTPMTMHTRLNASVTSEIGTPCFGLTVTVDAFTDPDTNKTYPAASAITDAEGNAEVSEFFAGTRTVTISGKEVIAQTFPAITFVKGKATDMRFIMYPSSFIIPAPAEKKQNTKA